MNKKQKIIKKIAKRTKARLNKVDPATIGAPIKSGYISKAERAKMAALEATTDRIESQQDTASDAE